MKSKPLLIALAGVALATPAQAETLSNWYVSGAVGLTSTNDADFDWPDLAAIPGSPTTGDFELDNTVHFAGALGASLTDHIRTELELSYRKADIDQTNLDGIGDVEAFLAGAGVPTGISGEVKTWGLLANVYYDFMPEQKFSPYVSGGLGAARHSGELTIGNVTDDASDTVFAYQLGAGASYDIAENTALFGGYRYFGTSDADFDGLEADYDAHELRIGIRYGF